MRKLLFNICFMLAVFTSGLYADGLMLSSDLNYPGGLLRNRVTEVSVKINGLVAETIVYQEFVNDWNKPVDAVYSFPLPIDARSTQLLYVRNDTTFKAILKVMPQIPNPGTGEGGIAALVNKYIGKNGLKLELKTIAPGAIQKVELHYISLLDYHKGKFTFVYPLDTKDFITYPLDHFEFNVDINSNSPITAFDITSHSGMQALVNTSNRVVLRLLKPIFYPASDLVFTYDAPNSNMKLDVYSTNTDSMDGHYALFFRPENSVVSPALNKVVIFLLSNSSTMVGSKLDQSIAAISEALNFLGPDDNFNIITYNSYVSKWLNSPIAANAENIANAKAYLLGISSAYGSRLDLGLSEALNQFNLQQSSNSIIAFTDGKSPLNPVSIQLANLYKIGIFPIGIGDDVDHSRLDMTAILNYGFSTYFKITDNIKTGVLRLFEKINNPLMKSTSVTINRTDIWGAEPEVLPSVFAGSYIMATGRYKTPGPASVTISGDTGNGTSSYNFDITLSDTSGIKTPEYLWAKEKMDRIERQIEVYGENLSLKDTLISLSLLYQMRCRYTSYFADYSTIFNTSVQDNTVNIINPGSYILSNYPNPFNPSTRIRFFIDKASEGKAAFIKIYNLLGQVVRIIPLNSSSQGWNEITFNAGNLVSGVYLAVLEIDNRMVSSYKIILAK